LEFQDFDLIRLGKVRNAVEECEPLIREVDGLAFNINAIRQSEAPAQISPMPSGLFIEEACQLVRYAGVSDRLTSIGFYGFEAKSDVADQTAKCIALMVWYFIDGIANRKNDYPISTVDMVEYIVDVKGFTLPLTFWKSNKSGRWWIQIPNSKGKKAQNYLFSCSYKDYQEACSGELPERIWNGFQRLG
jgi:formiminoglutamase